MEPILLTMMAVGVISIIGFIGYTQSKARKAGWAQASRAMALTLNEGGFFSSPKIEGRLGGCRISIYTYTRSTGKSQQSFTAIEVIGQLFDGLKLKKEGVGTSIGKLFVGDDMQIGDPHFDKQVHVQGAPMKAVALLDAEARAGVLDLLTDGGTIENNTLKWTTSGILTNAVTLEDQTRKLVRLANALSLGGRDVGEALGENAVRDPLPMVRMRNLELLLSSEAHRKTALETAQNCMQNDQHPAVVLLAALTLTNEGRSGAKRLVNERGVPESLRIQTLEKLESRGETAPIAVSDFSFTDSIPLAALRAALARWDEAKPHVERLVDHPEIPAMLRIQALEALGDRGEASLIASLDSSDVAVVRSAARALERCGTLAAVESLLKHSKGLLTDSELKQAARQAIDSIQARHGGGERGAFSIAAGGDQQGALSVAEEDRRGAISKAAKKPDPAR